MTIFNLTSCNNDHSFIIKLCPRPPKDKHNSSSFIMRVSKTRSNIDVNERRRRHGLLLLLTFVVIAVTLGILLQSTSYNNSSASSSLLAMEQLVLGGRGGTTTTHSETTEAADVSRRMKQSSYIKNKKNVIITPKTKAKPCTRQSISELHDKKWLQSQSHEDEYLLQNWFNGLCNGTYLEMGALDGITFSNSYVFNKAFHWNGLLIELAPQNYAKLIKNRKDDILVHAAVCDSPDNRRGGIVHYYQHPHKSLKALSGVYEFTSESFRNKYWTNLKPENGFKGLQEIQCIPLRDIIQEHMTVTSSKQRQVSTNSDNDNDSSEIVTLIDFFSLDVEGGEMTVLHSIDYEKVIFGIILVEADEHNLLKNMAIQTFLKRHGYTYIGDYQRSYWFVHDHFDEIYSNVLHADNSGGGGSGGGDTTAAAAAADAIQ